MAMELGRMTAYVLITCMIVALGGTVSGYDIEISGGMTSVELFRKKLFTQSDTKYRKFDTKSSTSCTYSLLIAGLTAALFASLLTKALGCNPSISIVLAGAALLAGLAFGGASYDMLITSHILIGVAVGFVTQVFISVIRSRYMEAKTRRKANSLTSDGFFWAFSPATGESFGNAEERDDFFSADSYFSHCSTTTDMEAFQSAGTHISHSSSLGDFDLPGFWRRSIIEEFCHCDGWPFGLYRKALLLPPLPKSPSESWSWSKGKSKSASMVKIP